jgi:hypothetical protein
VKVGLAGAAAAALVAAGCGGGSKTASDAASLAPQDARTLVTVDTRRLPRTTYPLQQRVLAQARATAAANGAGLRTIGRELAVAVLPGGGNVAFTQPRDPKRLAAALDRRHVLHRELSGWTVFSRSQASLDAVRHTKGSLADLPAYRAAAATVPGDAVSSVLHPTGRRWTATALSATDQGVKLEVHTKAPRRPLPSRNPLERAIPSAALLALSLARGAELPAPFRARLRGLGASVGIDLAALLDRFDGPRILYLRADLPLPEVTIAARPASPVATLRRVARGISTLAGTPVHPVGVGVETVDLGAITLSFGSDHGTIVLSNSVNALGELHGNLGRLVDDAAFEDAADGAGLPAAHRWFAYVNAQTALPAFAGFLQLANQRLSASAEAELHAFRTVLAYGARSRGVATQVTYLTTS